MEPVKNVQRQMDTTQAQVEWMDMEATNADMHARAGAAELILRTTWCAPVFDTDCLQPLQLTHGFSFEQRQPLAPLIPRHQWERRHCRCCGRLPVAPTRAPLARDAPRLCLVETVLLSPEGVLLLREAHAAIDEAPASGSMLRAVCVLCGCCVRE